jgi:hypothetical protein
VGRTESDIAVEFVTMEKACSLLDQDDLRGGSVYFMEARRHD